MGKWDKGLDYETMYVLFNRILESRRKRVKAKCYSAILLVQLRNGSRISEAIRAFKEFLRTGKTEVEIPVSKKRKAETRLMVIPEPVGEVAKECVNLLTINDKKLMLRIANWAKRMLNINTHSLRYAFITHLLRRGVNPSIVAKITKHRRLDYILTYTQEKEAERVLRDFDVV